MVVKLLLICVAFSLVKSDFIIHDSAITDIVSGPGNTVLVAAGPKLVRLSQNLELMESVTFSNCETTTVASKWDEVMTEVVVHLSNQSYLVYSTEQSLAMLFTNISSHVMLDTQPINKPVLFLDGHSFYTGNFIDMSTEYFTKELIFIGQFGYNYSDPIRTGMYTKSVSSVQFNRTFKGSFKLGSHVYFVVEDLVNGVPSFRILRVCTCDQSCHEEFFNALYEMELTGIPIYSTSRIVAVQHIDSDVGLSNEDVVMISISSDQNAAVYAYRVSEVNQIMKQNYDMCKMHKHVINIPWLEIKEKCKDFNVGKHVAPCDFNTFVSRVQALNSYFAARPEQVLTEVAGRVTTSLLVNVNGVLFLYLSHMNGSHSFTSKYHLTVLPQGTFSTTLVHQRTTPNGEPVNQLIRNETPVNNTDVIIAATDHLVFKFPVNECPEFSSCQECASSTSPLCGWCTLQGSCTMAGACSNQTLSQRWVTNTSFCLSGGSTIHVSDDVNAVEDFEQLPLNTTYGLPELIEGESLSCLFTSKQHNISISVPLINSSCEVHNQLATAFKDLELTVSLVGPLPAEPVITSIGNITVVSCSLAKRCSNCLELSSLCGWCIYGNQCASKASVCTESSHWIKGVNETSSDPALTCPHVLLPSNRLYKIQAATQLSLDTDHLPEQTEGYSYKCEMTRQGQATAAIVNAVYINSSKIICNFSSISVGVEGPAIENNTVRLLWVSEQNGSAYPIELLGSSGIIDIPARLYNCSAITKDCSTCVKTSLLLELECHWCPSLAPVLSCSSSNTACSAPAITNSNSCPLPTILSVDPQSGPTAGGTILTINGHDLGVQFSDIVSVAIGNTSCIPINGSYQLGVQLQCITGQFSAGNHSVTIQLQRQDELVSSNGGSFSYKEPAITGVFPPQGPQAGGTNVVITGVNLNIGNTNNTRVQLLHLPCQVKVIEEHRIECSTSSSDYTGNRIIRVFIDEAVVSNHGVVFEYKSNPVLNTVHPQSTIPRGGVAINFTGQHFDIVQSSTLTIVYNNVTHSSVCTVVSSDQLSCKAPALTNTSMAVLPGTLLTYSVMLDGLTLSPSSSGVLRLGLKPDPQFNSIFIDDIEREYGDVSPVRIVGTNIDSVARDEIEVTIDGEKCVITASTKETLTCEPPFVKSSDQKLSAPVKVDVGNGSLVFTVGALQYLRATRSILTTVLSVCIGCGVLVIAIVSLVGALILVRYWNKKHPPLQHLRRQSNKSIDTAKRSRDSSASQTNQYCDLIVDNPENIYESIGDPVYQNNAPPLKLSLKKLHDQRPFSDTMISPTYQNAQTNSHEKLLASSSSPDLSTSRYLSDHTSLSYLSSLSEEHIDGEGNTTEKRTEMKHMRTRVGRQLQRRKNSYRPNLEPTDKGASCAMGDENDYVSMYSSSDNCSPHIWETKPAKDSPTLESCDFKWPSSSEDQYITMQANTDVVDSPQPPEPYPPLPAKTSTKQEEYILMNPLLKRSMATPTTGSEAAEPNREDMLTSSGNDYVAMSSAN